MNNAKFILLNQAVMLLCCGMGFWAGLAVGWELQAWRQMVLKLRAGEKL